MTTVLLFLLKCQELPMKIISVHALSLDGAIAASAVENDAQRMLYGLTSPEDQERVERLLKESDAVVTGSNSLISAGKAWEVGNKSGNLVEWIVFTNNGLPADLAFWKQKEVERTLVSQVSFADLSTPTARFCANQLSIDKSLKNLVYAEKNPATEVVKYLQEKNAQQVLLFGGGKINKIFFEGKLVTHLEYTICPVILGGSQRVNLIDSGLNLPSKAKLLHTTLEKDHIFLSYELKHVNSLLE